MIHKNCTVLPFPKLGLGKYHRNFFACETYFSKFLLVIEITCIFTRSLDLIALSKKLFHQKSTRLEKLELSCKKNSSSYILFNLCMTCHLHHLATLVLCLICGFDNLRDLMNEWQKNILESGQK